MLQRTLSRYMPRIIAAFIALNGFIQLGTGLVPTFKLSQALDIEGRVPDYLQVTAAQQVSGWLSIFLGVLLIVLGKGLYERRKRAWYWSLGILVLLLVNNLQRGTTPETAAISMTLIAALAVFRREFNIATIRRKLEYGEIIAIISVIFALGYGIVGSYFLRREFNAIANVADAVYFTIVTFSTLGYGDILPQTTNAKIFTTSMVLIGLTSFVTALTVLLGPMIENRLKGVFAVMSRFQKTVNHVVICGFNDVSESIIDELNKYNTPFIVIDSREELTLQLKAKGFDTFLGDATQRITLEQANLPNATAVIAATEDDSVNILVGITAKALRDSDQRNQFRIIIRVEHEENIEKAKNIGADEVISPSTLGGRMMADKALGTEASK